MGNKSFPFIESAAKRARNIIIINKMFYPIIVIAYEKSVNIKHTFRRPRQLPFHPHFRRNRKAFPVFNYFRCRTTVSRWGSRAVAFFWCLHTQLGYIFYSCLPPAPQVSSKFIFYSVSTRTLFEGIN